MSGQSGSQSDISLSFQELFTWPFIYDIIGTARISTEGEPLLVNSAGEVIGYAHTRGYNAYKGKNWPVIGIETMSRG